MPFVDHTPRRIDPYLEWKVRLFVLGGGLALVAMLMDIGWLLGIAGALLGAGFVLRFLTRRHENALRAEGGEWGQDEWGEDEEEERP